jgi:hypothetical protein
VGTYGAIEKNQKQKIKNKIINTKIISQKFILIKNKRDKPEANLFYY